MKTERVRTDPLVRLMRYVDKDTETGCWNWTGTKEQNGYGQFRLNPETNMNMAHRVAYTLLVGPVRPELQLDHLCRNRGCVNPEHLEPVTPQINMDRGDGSRRSHCKKVGHPMSDQNTGARKDGRRYCMECHRARNTIRNARIAADKGARKAADARMTHGALSA